MREIKRSARIANVHSDIRGPLYQEALHMQSDGIEVLKLNTGNPGIFGFEMPQSVREALLRNADKAVPYCDLRGMPEAREAILAYHRAKGIEHLGADDIFIGNGVSELVQMAMIALIGNGDEVLIPSPNYSLWSNCVYIAGGSPVFYTCDESTGWFPDVEDIRAKVTKRTRAIVIINPNNPTGAVYSRAQLMEILEIARQNDLVVFSDEIYDRLVMDGLECCSTAALAPDLTVVTMNGLSKSHLICGFRCGWMAVSRSDRARDFMEGLVALAAMRLCGNALTQLVIPAALADPESTRALLVPGGRLYEQRAAVCRELDKIEGVSYVRNSAAFYLFPRLDKAQFDIVSDKQFAMDYLHAKHVLVIPGSGFDYPDNAHFRIVMLPEPERLAQAMRDLGDFLSDYRQKA
jgi:alanine-synthesizing transaminase